MASEDSGSMLRSRSFTRRIETAPHHRPFLLIVRTGRIVTAKRSLAQELRYAQLFDQRKNAVPPDTRSFQHLANCTHTITDVRGRLRLHSPELPTLGLL